MRLFELWEPQLSASPWWKSQLWKPSNLHLWIPWVNVTVRKLEIKGERQSSEPQSVSYKLSHSSWPGFLLHLQIVAFRTLWFCSFHNLVVTVSVVWKRRRFGSVASWVCCSEGATDWPWDLRHIYFLSLVSSLVKWGRKRSPLPAMDDFCGLVGQWTALCTLEEGVILKVSGFCWPLSSSGMKVFGSLCITHTMNMNEWYESINRRICIYFQISAMLNWLHSIRTLKPTNHADNVFDTTF